MFARGHGKAADSAENTGVGELGLRGDDAVGDVVVDGLDFAGQGTEIFRIALGPIQRSRFTHAVLLLLDLEDSAVLESPLDNISLLLGLDELAALQGAPEALEVLDWVCQRVLVRLVYLSQASVRGESNA